MITPVEKYWDRPGESSLEVAAGRGRIAWLALRTRPECDALLHEVLARNEATLWGCLPVARQSLADLRDVLHAYPQVQAWRDRPGRGDARRIGPGKFTLSRRDLDGAGMGTLLGWLFVVEGAGLHLHALERMAARASGRADDGTGDGAALARWRAFVIAAEQIPLGSADTNDMLAGARYAFHYIKDALEANERR